MELLAGVETSVELPWLDRNIVRGFTRSTSETVPRTHESGVSSERYDILDLSPICIRNWPGPGLPETA